MDVEADELTLTLVSFFFCVQKCSDEQKILLENCLSVVNRLPAVSTLPNDKDEAAFKNMWNFNLPDAASGLLLLDINQGKIATETRSQGKEHGSRQKWLSGCRSTISNIFFLAYA